MATQAPARHSNRELRTRKSLLEAASRLMRTGRKPTMDEIAEEALVSRATAYRYFRNVETLLVEAPLDSRVASPEEFFEGDEGANVVERVARVEAHFHEVSFRNESQLRLMLSGAVARDPEDDLPVRQNRRVPLIEAALAPARDRLGDETWKRLCAALAVLMASESMIVFRDVLREDEATARTVKSWAVRTLVAAALEEDDTE